MITSAEPCVTTENNGQDFSEPSFDTYGHVWTSDLRVPLGEVVEEERRAWLARSPTKRLNWNTDSDPVHSSISTPHFVEPTECVQKQGQSLCTELTEAQRRSSRHHSRITFESSKPGKARNTQDKSIASTYDGNGSRFQGKSSKRSAHAAALSRKPRFQEGSMTRGSAGVASTWKINEADVLDAAFPLTNDDGGMSKAITSARVSTDNCPSPTASVDINEFKPLPVTPSTLKATMKRFRRKPIHFDQTSESVDPQHDLTGPKLSAKNMRKSLSRWKLFANSTKDADSNGRAEALEARKGSADTLPTTCLPKHFKNEKLRFDPIVQEKSILDERKRKAEIAYAAQFGTIHKKQKHNPHNSQLSSSYTIHAQLPTDYPKLPAIPCRTTSIQSPIKTTIVPQHDQKKIHAFDPALPAFHHGPRRASRTELKKENQQLRSLLRESLSRGVIEKTNDLDDNYTATVDCGSRAGMDSLHNSARGPSNVVVHEGPLETCTGVKLSMTSKPSNTYDGQVPGSSVASKTGDIHRLHAFPPISFAATSNKTVGSTGMNRARCPSIDIHKRSDSNQTLHRKQQLSQSLSIVLEDLEEKSDVLARSAWDSTDTKFKSQIKRRHENDTDFNKENRTFRTLSKQDEKQGKASQENEQNWEWPEDCF